MSYYNEQKDMAMAVNGRMILKICCIFQLFTAITSTLFQGIGLVNMAGAAKKGEEEVVKLLTETGYSYGQINILGIVSIVTAIVMIAGCIVCLKFSNHLDKIRNLLIGTVVMLGVTVVRQIFMIVYKMTTLIGIVAAVLMPIMAIWAVSRYMKLAKKYPDKIYVILDEKKRNVQPKKKNIMEKAKATVKDEEQVFENKSEETE